MANYRKSDSVGMVLAVIILFAATIADTLLLSSIEEEKRVQARYNLVQVSHCYKELEGLVGQSKALMVCTGKMRTSVTGDIYVLDSNTLEFVHENSDDVPPIKLYFTKESVGKYFKDWSTAKAFISKVKENEASVYRTNAHYNFDGETEWLEWKSIPKTDLIVVQGIQEDEVLSNFASYRRFCVISVVFVVMVMLITHNVNIKRRRD